MVPRACSIRVFATERFLNSTSRKLYQIKNAVAACLQTESDLNYFVEDGRYWQHADKFDRKKLQEIDQKWLDAASLFPLEALL